MIASKKESWAHWDISLSTKQEREWWSQSFLRIICKLCALQNSLFERSSDDLTFAAALLLPQQGVRPSILKGRATLLSALRGFNICIEFNCSTRSNSIFQKIFLPVDDFLSMCPSKHLMTFCVETYVLVKFILIAWLRSWLVRIILLVKFVDLKSYIMDLNSEVCHIIRFHNK